MSPNESTGSYILLTHSLPATKYELRNGCVLRAVKSSEEMFEGIDNGNMVSVYPEVMALSFKDSIFPASYNTYRNLAIFHSFVSDQKDAFWYAVEYAVKKTYVDSELLPVGNSSRKPRRTVRAMNRLDSVDFDRFPMPLPTIASDDQEDLEGPDDTIAAEAPFANERREISYRNAFALFTELGEIGDEDEGNYLYDQICSYIFILSIWDIKNVRLLYANEDVSATFYIAILESILGEPDICCKKFSCEVCGRKLQDHHRQTWRDHLTEKLNLLESGWGDRYMDAIMKLRDRRHKFSHEATYFDMMQQLWNIYDKKYYYGRTFAQSDLEKEERLHLRSESLEILERTVRRCLVQSFIGQYEQQFHVPSK